MAGSVEQVPVAEWRVGLTGDPFDLDELVADFAGPGVAVTQVGGQYWLSSTEFEHLPTADQVRARAAELVQDLNGAASFGIGGFHAVGVGHVSRVRADGGRDAFLYVEGMLTLRGNVIPPLVNGQARQSPRVVGLHAIASKNAAIRDALRFWQSRHENMAVNLYKVWEVIGHDLVGRARLKAWNAAIESRGWATPAETDGFRAVHDPTLLGDQARHGVRNTPSPASPMTLDDAAAFVRRVMDEWLRSKGWSG